MSDKSSMFFHDVVPERHHLLLVEGGFAARDLLQAVSMTFSLMLGVVDQERPDETDDFGALYARCRFGDSGASLPDVRRCCAWIRYRSLVSAVANSPIRVRTPPGCHDLDCRAIMEHRCSAGSGPRGGVYGVTPPLLDLPRP